MSNSLSASFPVYFSRRMQLKRKRENVYPIIASFAERKTLKKGYRVERPYRSTLYVNTIGTDGAYSRQDVTDTQQYMDIDVKKEITFYLEEYNEIQHNYKVANEYADDAGRDMYNWVDGDVLGEYDQAASVVANYEMVASGSASDGIGFTLSTSNVLSVFGKVRRKLKNLHIPIKGRWAIISPEFEDILYQYLAGKESALGDSTGLNGHIGKYGGFNLYVSEGCGWSARLEMGTNPTANDTVVINGVTFTFVASVGTAGNLHICDTAAETVANMVAAINTPGTAITESGSGGYTAITSANQNLLKGITATDGTTYMTLKAEGHGSVVVSETLTAAADIWTTTKQLQHILFGQGKPIDLVLQKYPNSSVQRRTGYIGRDFINWMLYGLKTFNDGKDALVDVQIRSDAF